MHFLGGGGILLFSTLLTARRGCHWGRSYDHAIHHSARMQHASPHLLRYT
jgi:hypothetical protein